MDVSAQILRDLHFRKQESGLNDYEQKVMEATERMFIREWAIIEDISEEEAQEKLEKIYEEIFA